MQIFQIATEKPITQFVNNNIKEDFVSGDVITFKYGGLFYTRFCVDVDNEDKEDKMSACYKILIKGIRKSLLKV